MYSSFLHNFLGVLEYGFSSSVPALEYLFPLAVGIFKGRTEVSYSLCSAATSARNFSHIYNSKQVVTYLMTAKESTENFWRFTNMLCLLQNSIGGMMRTELAVLRDALTDFQIL